MNDKIIEEKIINFETAKLAKNFGFDLECYYAYNNEKNLELALDFIGEYKFTINDIDNANNNYYKSLLAPSQFLLQTWLREKYKFHVCIETLFDHEIYGQKDKWKFTITHLNSAAYYDNLNEYDSYEECLEAGLQKALTLIKK